MLLSEIIHASNNMHKNIQHSISRSNIRYTESSMGRAKTDYIELLSYANVYEYFQRCELFVLNNFRNSHTHHIKY